MTTSCAFVLDGREGRFDVWPWTLYPRYGAAEVAFQHLRTRPPFDSTSVWNELRRQLLRIPDVDLPEGKLDLRPSFPLSVLTSDTAMPGHVIPWGRGRASPRRDDVVTAPPRRGRPAQLTRDAILDAAERLATTGGAAAITMRAVAGELGVSPMAVYRHVRDKDALLVAVLDRQVAGLRWPRLPRDPRGRVLRLFRWLYDELDERPWVVDVLTRGDVYAPRIMPAVEEILAGFVALGLTPKRAVDAYLTCWRYMVGTLVIRHASARVLPTLARPPVQAQAIQAADASTLPLLAQTRDYWPRARAAFNYRRGLAAVVDGLVTSLDS